MVGAKETKQKLTDLASYNDVAIEFFIDPFKPYQNSKPSLARLSLA
jgi:hypothetical protein